VSSFYTLRVTKVIRFARSIANQCALLGGFKAVVKSYEKTCRESKAEVILQNQPMILPVGTGYDK
jgi:hypothetical protein